MRLLLLVLPALLAVATAQDHFIDVRALVKDTIDAIKEVPAMMNQNQNQTTSTSPAAETEKTTTTEPTKVVKARADVYDSLLKLPGDIMSQLARDAGFVDEKTQKAAVAEEKKEEERVEKKKEEEESYSFKTVDDLKAEESRQLNERPTVAKKVEDNDDIFSISKLISATGNAIREAQAAQAAQQPQQQPQQEPMITLPPLVPLPPAPLQMPALQMPAVPAAASPPTTEIMFRQVVRDGKTVYEQVVVVKEADGTMKFLPSSVLPQLPVEAPKQFEVKKVNKEAAEFLAPTFPPAVNLFDQLTSTTAASTTSTTTTEEPEPTTEVAKPRRKSLPRRKIHYLEKKAKDMHSRQFGAKTVQMSDPIEIQAQEEQEPVNVLQKEVSVGNLRVHAINNRRKSRKPRVVKVENTEKVEEVEKVEEKPVEEEPEEATEPPKKRRQLRKVHKKVVKKEIRKLPDLYDEQWKTQVAPSVSPPSEEFAEQFDGVDEIQESPKRKALVQEPQNDTPMNDPMEQRSSKIQMMTKEQEEEILSKEIHKRVLQRIRLSKLKGSSKMEEATTTTTSTTTTEEPTTTTTEKEVEEEEEEVEVPEEEVEEEELNEEEEQEEVTTTTTTTTEAPVPKKNRKRAVVTKHQCLNLRSFARQFLFDTVEEFAKEHCYFIENYYPALTCARSHVYVAKCQRWLKEEE